MYDWLVDHEDIKRILTEMSETRTLLADLEAYQAPRFNFGDKVRIKAGDYAGIVVTVTRIDRLESGSWIVEHDLHGLPYYEEAMELVSENKPRIACSMCGKALTPATPFEYDGLLYCPDCLPVYDKHQQFSLFRLTWVPAWASHSYERNNNVSQ